MTDEDRILQVLATSPAIRWTEVRSLARMETNRCHLALQRLVAAGKVHKALAPKYGQKRPYLYQRVTGC